MNSRLSNYVKTKFVRIAGDLMDNPQGLKFKLEKAAEKISKKSVVEAIGIYVDDLKALIRLGKLWATRKYTDIETQTILYTIVAVVYFVTPTDFVPDFVLGLGFIDDVAVINWVLSIVKNDLDKFKKWEAQKKNKKNKSSNELHSDQIELNLNESKKTDIKQKKA